MLQNLASLDFANIFANFCTQKTKFYTSEKNAQLKLHTIAESIIRIFWEGGKSGKSPWYLDLQRPLYDVQIF